MNRSSAPLLSPCFLVFLCLSLIRPSASCQTVEWIRQFGTPIEDYASGVAADHLGNVYVVSNSAGLTGFLGPTLSRYDASGTLKWSRLLTMRSVYSDRADDSDNVFVSGTVVNGLGPYDAFVAKYDADGSGIWTQQIVTISADAGSDVTTDHFGNVYLAGTAGRSLQSPLDQHNNGGAFVAKYSSVGSLAWVRQIDSSDCWGVGSAISIDGDVYLVGGRRHILNPGTAGQQVYDVPFVAKYDPAGSLIWDREFSTTAGSTLPSAVTLDHEGNLYVVGNTDQSLAGSNAGKHDGFLAKYDLAGNLAGIRQFGSRFDDTITGIATDEEDNRVFDRLRSTWSQSAIRWF